MELAHKNEDEAQSTNPTRGHSLDQTFRGLMPDMRSNPILSVSDLSIGLGGTKSLWSGVNLSLRPGEIITVLGPSGCGKTTLLDCLAGGLVPNSGEVRWSAPRRARIHQDLRLVGERSALANVLHGSFARTKGFFRFRFSAEEKRKALGLLDELGIAHKAAVAVKLLSLGEQQRVAVARALMAEPAVLLADEPVSALDKETAERIFSALERRARIHGLAVICVLHQPELAHRYGHRVLRLTGGCLDDVTRAPSSAYPLQ